MSNSLPSPARYTPTGLAAQLDDEWDHLRFDRRRLRRVASWELPLPDAVRLNGIADLEDVVAATDRRCGARGDAVARALVERAEHDPLATTILLRRLLPLLLAAVRRYGWTTDTPAEQVLSAACVAIRRYDTKTRPRHVVPALASDAEYLAFRRELRRRGAASVVEVAVGADVLEHAARAAAHHDVGAYVESARNELDDVLAAASCRGVSVADVELLAALGTGTTVQHIAERMQVTDRTVRNRRRAAVHRVRAAVGVRSAA